MVMWYEGDVVEEGDVQFGGVSVDRDQAKQGGVRTW
jgi:hypothetical protein